MLIQASIKVIKCVLTQDIFNNLRYCEIEVDLDSRKVPYVALPLTENKHVAPSLVTGVTTNDKM